MKKSLSTVPVLFVAVLAVCGFGFVALFGPCFPEGYVTDSQVRNELYQALDDFARQSGLDVEYGGAPSCGLEGLTEILHYQTPSQFSSEGIAYEASISATYSPHSQSVTVQFLAYGSPKTKAVPQLLEWLNDVIAKFESDPQTHEFFGQFREDRGAGLEGFIGGDYIQLEVGTSAYLYYSLPNQSVTHYSFPEYP